MKASPVAFNRFKPMLRVTVLLLVPLPVFASGEILLWLFISIGNAFLGLASGELISWFLGLRLRKIAFGLISFGGFLLSLFLSSMAKSYYFNRPIWQPHHDIITVSASAVLGEVLYIAILWAIFRWAYTSSWKKTTQGK